MKFKDLFLITLIFTNVICSENTTKKENDQEKPIEKNIHYYVSRSIALTVYSLLTTCKKLQIGQKLVQASKEMPEFIALMSSIYLYNQTGNLLNKCTKKDESDPNYKYYFRTLKSLMGFAAGYFTFSNIKYLDRYDSSHQLIIGLGTLQLVNSTWKTLQVIKKNMEDNPSNSANKNMVFLPNFIAMD